MAFLMILESKFKRIKGDYISVSETKQSMLHVDVAMGYLCDFQNETQRPLCFNSFTAAYFHKRAYTVSFSFCHRL